LSAVFYIIAADMQSKVLCFATRNANKLVEIRQRVPPGISLIDLNELGQKDELPETGDTLEHNSLEKARFVLVKYGIDCFADDTGLEVYALGNKPGVHSARYAGEDKDSDANMALLLRNLDGIADRRARFRTIISLLWKGSEYLFEGIAEGHIARKRRGDQGFGYDPIFIPEGSDRCFAEMSLEEKNSISHRAKAFDKLIAFLTEEV
jgi:XTP/dITP diphosphohydrolase